MRRYRWCLALPLLALALGGCTRTAVQTLNEAPTQVVTPPTTTTPSLPPRPRSLPLEHISPCTLLTAGQREQLSLDEKPAPYVDQDFAQSRACSIRGRDSGMVARLAMVTTEGIDVWLSNTAQVQAKVVSTGGFPALEVRTPGLELACNIEVDVAAHQFLDVLFRDGGNASPIGQDELCLGAQRVAEAAVQSLVARYP